MKSGLYRGVVKSLSVSITLLNLSIIGCLVLLIFAMEDSLRVLTIVGLFDGQGPKDYSLIWIIAFLPVIAVAWAEFRFVPKVRRLLEAENGEGARFGESNEDEKLDLSELRGIINKYAIFVVAGSFAAIYFINMQFINILVCIALLVLQLGLLMFFREKAKLLRAGSALLR